MATAASYWTWIWMRDWNDQITSQWLDAQRRVTRAEADETARAWAGEGQWDTFNRYGGVSFQAQRVFLCEYNENTRSWGPWREIALAPVNRLARWDPYLNRAVTEAERQRLRSGGAVAVNGPLGAERQSKFWTGRRWVTVTWWDPDAVPDDRRYKPPEVGQAESSSSSKGSGLGLVLAVLGVGWMLTRRPSSHGTPTTSGRPLHE